MMNISYQPTFKLLLTVCVLGLTACSDRVTTAEQAMAEIRNQPARPIEPPPQPQIIEDFVYSANDLRSPFVPPGLTNLQSVSVENMGVRPDLNREKEPLESYELSQLVYTGRIEFPPPGKEEYGLIQLPDGSIVSVKVGDYLGLNDGQVREITPTQINLVEIVPDSRAGFIEQPQSLVSPVN